MLSLVIHTCIHEYCHTSTHQLKVMVVKTPTPPLDNIMVVFIRLNAQRHVLSTFISAKGNHRTYDGREDVAR